MKQLYPSLPKVKLHEKQFLPFIFFLAFIFPFTSFAADIKLEAESATLTGVTVATSPAGFSGSGYVWNFDSPSDEVAFTFNAPAGQYELTIGYTSPYGEKGYGLKVNGNVSDKMFSNTGATFGAAAAGKYQLQEGSNSISITNGWGYFGIDYIKLTPVATNILLEAENAILNGVGVATAYAGYSGDGYAWGFDAGSDNITFSFPTAAGEYELSVIYTSPYGDKKTRLEVNGQSSEQDFKGTSGAFHTLLVGKFLLSDGGNTIKFTSNWGYYGIDYIVLKPVSSAPPVPINLVNGRAEAELGVFDGVSASTSPAGFSGTGYVTSFDNATDKLTINFNATGGLYDLSIGYTSPFGEKGYDLKVNEETGSGMFNNTGNTFSTASAGKFYIKEGVNTITITRGWGYFGIDYIQLTPSVVALPVKPPKLLADKNATQSTKSLFSYMIDEYGSKIISAQQENSQLTEVDYIKSVSGKEVAIASVDLMDYSPSRIAFGSNPGTYAEKAIAWSKKEDGKGIISLMWHWNAPTDLINEAPDKLWWSGFYSRATTFDFAAALADTNSERYKLILRDIDAIAVQLKKFRDADIPVLWRPLHEAAGGWFWWGTKGATAYKELWKLLYNRLTDYHQLHNLIWVYTAERNKPDWYPGDEYTDIVSIDIYESGATASSMSGQWSELQTLFGGKKLVALSETGNLPNLDYVKAYGTWWSYFGVWTGDNYIRKQTPALVTAVFNHPDVITRDELPDWRMYGRPTVELTAPAANSEYLVCQSPALSASASDAEGSVVKVSFIANNTVIGVDNTPADGFTFNWTGATAGTYAVVAEATDNEGNTNRSAAISIKINPDVTAPVITLTTNKATLIAEDHLMKTFSLSNIVSSTTDNCSIVKVVRIKQVSSDEAADGGGSGNTAQDIIISADGQSVQLRAERAGTEDGRVYTIQIEAIDNYGNTGLASYEVHVPKSAAITAIAGAAAYWIVGNYTSGAARSATVVTRTNETEVKDVRIYPNPVNGNQLTIFIYSVVPQNATFTLYNNNSQGVFSQQKTLHAGANQVRFPLSKVQSGVYFLRILKGADQYTKKVIVNK